VLPADMAITVRRARTRMEGEAVLGLMTEHNALATAGRMQAGENVLVHAAGGSGLRRCSSQPSWARPR
jgi:NADPH:quinone reductase-like Zn-dependent oxidoreductase